MEKMLWDPRNLLQITSDEDENADIRCVGISRSAVGCRCRQSISDSETAHRLLLDLPSMMPSEVSASKLDSLASACLCLFHNDQRSKTVERWIGVLERATKQYECLQKSAIEEQDKRLIFDLRMLRTGGSLTLGESSQFIRVLKDTMSTLDKETASLNRQLSAVNMANEVFRNSSNVSQGKVVSLQMENDKFRKEVGSLHRENKELQISRDSMVDQFRGASAKIDDLHNEIQQLSSEVELRNQSLQQSHVELQQERACGLTLQNKVTTMEQRIMVLEGNISTCWLHAFCMWINRQLRELAAFVLDRGSRLQRGMFRWSSLLKMPEPTELCLGKLRRD